MLWGTYSGHLGASPRLPSETLNLGGWSPSWGGGLLNLRGKPLTELDLSGFTALEDDDLRYLRGLPLTKLRLSSCRLRGNGFSYLKGLPLTYLSLYDCYLLEAECLRHLHDVPIETLNLTLCLNLLKMDSLHELAGFGSLQRVFIGKDSRYNWEIAPSSHLRLYASTDAVLKPILDILVPESGW